MTLQERLARVFPEPQKRGYQAQIAKACKVSSATVSHWFKSPRKVSTIDRAHAEAICAAFKLDVEPRWLSDGTGPMARTSALSAPPVAAEMQIEVALQILGDAIVASDDLSRLQVAALVETWFRHPGRNDEIRRRIIGLLRAATAEREVKNIATEEEHQ